MIEHDTYLNKDFKKLEPCDEDVGKAFQMDDYGNFRIVVNGKSGEWKSYNSIATVEVDGILYIDVSAYYEGVLPHECVLKVEKTTFV